MIALELQMQTHQMSRTPPQPQPIPIPSDVTHPTTTTTATPTHPSTTVHIHHHVLSRRRAQQSSSGRRKWFHVRDSQWKFGTTHLASPLFGRMGCGCPHAPAPWIVVVGVHEPNFRSVVAISGTLQHTGNRNQCKLDVLPFCVS